MYFQSLLRLGRKGVEVNIVIVIRESGLTLWYEEACVDVILCDGMWDTCR